VLTTVTIDMKYADLVHVCRLIHPWCWM